MSYLLRTESGLKLCYGEPRYSYVVTSNGSYFEAGEYQEMCDEEKEVEANAQMEDENWPRQGWADVCQNDLGISVSEDIGEYLLQGKQLGVNEFVELETV